MNYLMYNIVKLKESMECEELNHIVRKEKKIFRESENSRPKI